MPDTHFGDIRWTGHDCMTDDIACAPDEVDAAIVFRAHVNVLLGEGGER